MVIRFFKKWFVYYRIRHELKKGKTLTTLIKVSERFHEFSLVNQKKLLNNECHKTMMKYDMELDFSYDIATIDDDVIKGLQTIKIKFKLKQI